MTRPRLLIIAVLICSLALAGAGREWAWDLRRAATADPTLTTTAAGDAARAQSGNSLADMDSYALALLLGGLRGPLVMFLWSTSETQKSAHDLTDFDTKVEWIRLLQPEFDTVHMFQIWNKAYNISVQMSNLPDKYTTILDALDYANSVDRPDDLNILYAIAMTYGDKMGQGQDSDYYIRRVRQETQAIGPIARVTLPSARLESLLTAAHAAGMDEPLATSLVDDQSTNVTLTLPAAIAEKLRPIFSDSRVSFQILPPPRLANNAAVKRDRLDPILDADGNLLPNLLVAAHPRPSGMDAAAPWYDGSTMQFLKPYEPFPYGVPPQGIGYNYYKRAQMLQWLAHEEPLEASEFVIDSRPSLALKMWAAEEADEGRRAELRLFGLDDQGERLSLELRVLGNEAKAAADPAAGPRALFEYAQAARLYRDTRTELLAHMLRFPASRDNLASHVQDTLAFEPFYQADHDFLDGVLNPAARSSAWASAADGYKRAGDQFELILLKYYVDDDLVQNIFPINPATGQRWTRQTINQMPVGLRDPVLGNILAAGKSYYQAHYDQFADERNEYLSYIDRCESRLKMIGVVGQDPKGR